MTLLEMLVVMALLSGFFMMSMPFIKKREHAIQQTFRQIKALNRQLDSQARIDRVTYRLVIVLGLQTEEGSSWWVEKKTTPIDSSIAVETDESKDSASINEEVIAEANTSADADADVGVSADGFVMDKSFFEERQKLPENLLFESISFSDQQNDSVVSNGQAYIYYLPGGQSHKILLKIKGKKQHWSLLFDRLKGELDILPGNKTWEELPL